MILKLHQFSLKDLADVYVGDSKQMNKGCGPHVDGTQDGSGYAWMKNRGFGWPENGEFEWGGPGKVVGLCSDIGGGYGCECSGGKCQWLASEAKSNASRSKVIQQNVVCKIRLLKTAQKF